MPPAIGCYGNDFALQYYRTGGSDPSIISRYCHIDPDLMIWPVGPAVWLALNPVDCNFMDISSAAHLFTWNSHPCRNIAAVPMVPNGTQLRLTEYYWKPGARVRKVGTYLVVLSWLEFTSYSVLLKLY